MAHIKEVREIPLQNLTIGKAQARTRNVNKEIDELAASIQKVGLLEPIVVCESDLEGKYEIVTGQRRFMAHVHLETETILAAILDESVDELTAKVLSVTENLVRLDLNSSDLIDVCTWLYKHYGSIKAVVEQTGLSYPKVSQYVKYDQLVPQLQVLVDDSSVPLPTALRAQQAASSSGDINIEEAVMFAKEMAPMSGAQQKKILDERKKDPTTPADDVIETAKTGGRITQLVVTLTSEVHTALGQYAQSEGTNSDDAAGRLIQDGLYINDFWKEPAS